MNDRAQNWCKDIRDRYERWFSTTPKHPNLVELDTQLQERMLRIGIEAHILGINTDNRDEIAIVAHHTLLLEELQSRGNQPRYGV